MSRYVSYSQFSMYLNCPRKWELEYADNKRVYRQSIHTLFGTCIHNTLQHYLTMMYEQTAKAANELDLSKYLIDNMKLLYAEAVHNDNGNHFSTPEQLSEFCLDGIAILDFVKKKRAVYFSSRHHSLVGIEVPLNMPITEHVGFKGFVDLIIKDERDGTITIWDIKTSTSGWNKYQKKDKTKTAQLVLYKEFYSKQFNVNPDDIHIEYFIVRRKINEDLEFVPKRVQLFAPANGKVTRNRVVKQLHEFVDQCFNSDGTYNREREYEAVASSGCKFCPYVDDQQLCPKASRRKKP